MFKRYALIGAIFVLFSATVQATTYVVGSGGTYRPFEFENAQKQLEGFDVDVIKAIAKAENFDIKLVNTPWESTYTTLYSRWFDNSVPTLPVH